MKTMNRYVIICFMLCAFLLLNVQSLFAIGNQTSGNATLNGTNGYIVIPSAEPAWENKTTTVTTGYSAVFSGSLANIPYVQFGFSRDFEMSVAMDLTTSIDLLLSGKWRFDTKGNRSLALGFTGQALNISNTTNLAGQFYFASTFNSTFIDWPSKTTLLLGYTLDGTPNTDIDFGMGFQTPFMKDVFNGKVDFVLDFGNVSYSISPSGGNLGRGLLNIGLRLLPIEITDRMYVSADLRGLDILDSSGRAVSASVAFSFDPK